MTSAPQTTKSTPPTDVSAEMATIKSMESAEDAPTGESITQSLSLVTASLEKSSSATCACLFAPETRPGWLMEPVTVLLDSSECTTKFA